MNKADKIFKENIRDILDNGYWDSNPRPVYESDGAPAYTKYITFTNEKYDLSKGEFPITTLRPIEFKKSIGEILWIWSDKTSDLSVLEEKYSIYWWRQWSLEDNSIGARYGNTVGRYNLTDKIINELKTNKYSRRMIASMWQEEELKSYAKLPPCAFEIAFMVRTVNGVDYLDAHLSQRSNDYLVSGHLNMMQYVALQMMITHEVGMKVGTFSRNVYNLHIYNRHIEQAHELLSREPSKEQPKLILKADGKSFYDITIDDFEMVDYEPVQPQLSFDLGV